MKNNNRNKPIKIQTFKNSVQKQQVKNRTNAYRRMASRNRDEKTAKEQKTTTATNINRENKKSNSKKT